MSQTGSTDEASRNLAEARKQAIEQLAVLTSTLPTLERSVPISDLEPVVRALALTTRLLTLHGETPSDDKGRPVSTGELMEAVSSLNRSRQAIQPLSPVAPMMQTLLESVKLLVALAAASECQMAVPFAPMYQVRKPNGKVVWQCSHDPMHET